MINEHNVYWTQVDGGASCHKGNLMLISLKTFKEGKIHKTVKEKCKQ